MLQSRKTERVRAIDVDYVVRDGAAIAFEVFGDGPVDLLVTQHLSPIDLLWELPQLAEFMEALGRMARVIAFDARGHGASDPLATTAGAAGMESSADDLLAVLDAAGADRVTILEQFGTQAVTFAATYPERVRSLIIMHPRSSFPEMRGFSFAQRHRMALALATTRSLRSENPRVAHDPLLQEWWVRARRLESSPAAKARQMEYAANTDTSSVLPSVRVPALLFHRLDNRMWDIETTRAFAAQLPNSRLVELPGSEQAIFLGDTSPVLIEIEQFLREKEVEALDDRPLATVLFTDMVASTEQLAARGDAAWRRVLDDHDLAVERIVAGYRGRVVKSTGDGILATFDGPARAVRCAQALLDAAAEQGVTLRAGLHTGEIELRPNDLAGIAVHIASRITTLAAPHEILVSRTVVDLTAGSGLRFEPHGERELKGVPGTWPTFAATVPT
jgi:class 3 adenylate cyclase